MYFSWVSLNDWFILSMVSMSSRLSTSSSVRVKGGSFTTGVSSSITLCTASGTFIVLLGNFMSAASNFIHRT